jgi:hypothetical protein
MTKSTKISITTNFLPLFMGALGGIFLAGTLFAAIVKGIGAAMSKTSD